LKADIWGLVNPEISKGRVPVLEPPARPTPDDVKEVSTLAQTESPGESTETESTAGTVKYSKLSEDEKQQLAILQKDYKFDRKRYKQRKDSLNDIRIQIQETVDWKYLSYTFKCNTLCDMLVNLKRRFAPTDKA
jgi:hypothetical protein